LEEGYIKNLKLAKNSGRKFYNQLFFPKKAKHFGPEGRMKTVTFSKLLID